ncbi:hypothetical protein CF327_g856 [Tilletia walkeri]|nr:hypothetical protein CF327_g856 [Tilletia walkeri]
MSASASTSSAHAAESDPYATIRSSHSNRKAPGRTPILPATASSPSFPPHRTSTPNTSSSSCSPHVRPASPTPSTFSASSSHSSTTSSFKRRRTSVDSVTTDWTGSLPRNNPRAKAGSRIDHSSNRDSIGSTSSAAEAASLQKSSSTASLTTTQNAQIAFEELFHATAFALERSNELLLSTLNSRSQLASLRAQQSAIEQGMNARELELRRRLEANRDMAEWVRQSGEQLEALVRELDADRLRAAGGPAMDSNGGGPSAWGFARPTHWRVPSLGGLGAVFGAAGEETTPGGTAELPGINPSSETSTGPAEDGTMTIGKTAAKRLERVLIKHKRGQSSLSIASSMQGQAGHARNSSVASSRLETPIFLNGGGSGGGGGAGDGDAAVRPTSPANSPLARMVDLQEEPQESEENKPISEKETKAANESSAGFSKLAHSKNIPATPTSGRHPNAPIRSSKLVRPGKPGLGLRLGPSAPSTASTSTAALSSPTVVVSPSGGGAGANGMSSPPPDVSISRNLAFASRRNDSHASLTSIDEDDSGFGSSTTMAHKRSGRFSFGTPLGPGAGVGAPPSPAAVDRCISPALSIQFTPGGPRRTPSQRGSISSLNSLNSVRSERFMNASSSSGGGGGMGSPAFSKPRALAVAASAPASRLEVPTVLSGPAWSASELGTGLPETAGGGGALDTLSALLSRSPASPSRPPSTSSVQRAAEVPASSSSSVGAEEDKDEEEEENDEDAHFTAYLHNSGRNDSSQPHSIHIPSPKVVDSRRLSSQSNASRISNLSMANLRSPRLARLDSGSASALAAQASSDLAAGWTGETRGREFGGMMKNGAGVSGGGAEGGGGRVGALAALKRLNEQKGVLPGGPEVDGRYLSEGAGGGGTAGGGGGTGAWASITSWVGLGLGSGGGGASSAGGEDTSPENAGGAKVAGSATSSSAAAVQEV